MSKDGRLVGAIVMAILSMGFMLSPAAWGEVLEVTGNRAVETDVVCTGLRFFGGDWTLSGPGRVLIADDGEGIVVADGQATIACEVQVGATSGHAEQPINITSGASLTVAKDGGCISGAADLRADGAGEIVMNGVNTFDGKLSILAGRFTANNDAAFGSTVGGTYVRMLTAETVTDRTVTFGGIVTHENFEWQSRLNKDGMVVFPANATNEFYGNWTTLKTSAEDAPAGRNTMVYATYGQKSRTVYRGQIGWLQDCRCTSDATAVIEFLGSYSASVLECSAGTWHIGARMTAPMSVSNDSENRGGLGIVSSSTRIIMDAENCFSPNSDDLSVYGAHFSARQNGILDLNGYSQHFGFLQGTYSAVITSALPATVYVDLCKSGAATTEADKTCAAIFRDKVSLTFSGTEKTQTLTGMSTATGDLTVKAGAGVTLSPTAKWGGDVVIEDAGSVLVLQSATAFKNDSTVTIRDGGKLRFDCGGEACTIRKLVVGGNEYARAASIGPIGSGADLELSELEGEGVLNVVPAAGLTHTFSPAGAGDLSKISDAANWVDGKPDFAAGNDTVVFAQSGSEARIDIDGMVKGIVLERPAGTSYTFNGADGGVLSIGDGGLTAAGGTGDAPRAFTNNASLNLVGKQTWSIPCASEFVQNGTLSGSSASDVTVRGAADFRLYGDASAFKGKMTYVCDQTDLGGAVHLYNGSALGGVGAEIIFDRNKNDVPASDHCLQFRPHGSMVIPCDVKFLGNSVSGTPRAVFEKNATNEFAGKFSSTVAFTAFSETIDGTKVYPQGHRLVFSGGFDFAKGIEGTIYSETLLFTNKSGRIGKIEAADTWPSADPTVFELHTPSNVWDLAYGMTLTGWCRVRCHAPDAILYNAEKDTPRIYFAPGGSQKHMPRIDLGGFDQSCGYLSEREYNATSEPAASYISDEKFALIENLALVESSGPAQLVAHQSVDRTLRTFSWRGKAGLTLEGDKTLTLRDTPSTTKGRLAVRGGKLVLGAGAAWTSVSEVEVTDGGVLTLTGSGLVNRKANWYFGDDGKVTIPAGVTVKAKSLSLRNGAGKYEVQPGGTYTKANCSFVEGDGALVAGPLGFVISVR